MGTIYEESSVRFEGVVYEDEIAGLRDYLQIAAPSQIVFDFSLCDDLHLGILQVILAYKKLYGCSYIFGNEKKFYQKVCEGFDESEAHCA